MLRQLRAGTKQVFTIIEHQQELTTGQVACQQLQQRLVGGFAHVQRICYFRQHQRSIGHAVQRNPANPIGEGVLGIG